MPKFVLLLHGDPSAWDKLSPEEMQQAMEQYRAWMHKPFNVGGDRLTADAGKVMRTVDGQTKTTDGPFSETKEIFGGYYMIEAADYDEAVQRASDHPHLKMGTVEVRQIWEM